jgi:hypothetical protein
MNDLTATIRALSESDISVGLQTAQGGGLLLWIGDEIQGLEAQRGFRFDELEAAVKWLRHAACVCYPASSYAQHLTGWVQPPMEVRAARAVREQ